MSCTRHKLFLVHLQSKVQAGKWRLFCSIVITYAGSDCDVRTLYYKVLKEFTSVVNGEYAQTCRTKLFGGGERVEQALQGKGKAKAIRLTLA